MIDYIRIKKYSSDRHCCFLDGEKMSSYFPSLYINMRWPIDGCLTLAFIGSLIGHRIQRRVNHFLIPDFCVETWLTKTICWSMTDILNPEHFNGEITGIRRCICRWSNFLSIVSIRVPSAWTNTGTFGCTRQSRIHSMRQSGRRSSFKMDKSRKLD